MTAARMSSPLISPPKTVTARAIITQLLYSVANKGLRLTRVSLALTFFGEKHCGNEKIGAGTQARPECHCRQS
jgi:hypothetical protein